MPLTYPEELSMPSSADRHCAVGVEVTDTRLIVELKDGRKISVPIDWYPRLAKATPRQRARWRLVGRIGIYWPGLDEALTTLALLAGNPSIEHVRAVRAALRTG